MILKTSGRQALREETEKTNTDLNLRCGHRRHSQTELDNKAQTKTARHIYDIDMERTRNNKQ